MVSLVEVEDENRGEGVQEGENSDEGFRDWTSLHDDLIELISKKLSFTNTYCRFRAVCRPWRLASSPDPHMFSPFPWLQLPQTTRTMSSLSLYDFSRTKTHRFDLPLLLVKNFFNTSSSWLLLEKDMNISLFNPITHEEKTGLIPPLSACPTILGFAVSENAPNPLPSVSENAPNPLPSLYRVRSFNLTIIEKVVLTSSPYDKDCFVVAKFLKSSEWELGFCKIGDDHWTILKLRDYDNEMSSILDFTYEGELVYAINKIGHVTIYNLQNLSRKVMIANLNCSNCHKLHLLQGIKGKLEKIPLAVKESGLDLGFEVCKCIYDKLHGKHRWAPVRDIGNSVLFLDSRECKMVSLDDFRSDGLEKNHICFCECCTGDNGCHTFTVKMAPIDQTRSFKEIPASLDVYSRIPIGEPSWFSYGIY